MSTATATAAVPAAKRPLMLPAWQAYAQPRLEHPVPVETAATASRAKLPAEKPAGLAAEAYAPVPRKNTATLVQ